MAELSRENRSSEGDILRGVVAIVLTGVALGVAHNALGLAGKPPRGLAWIKQEVELPKLEDLVAGASSAPAASSGEAAAATPAAQEITQAAPETGTAGAAPPPKAAAPSAAPSPPISGYDEMSDPLGMRDVPQSGLPEIPDLGRPLQVQLPAVKKFFDAGAAVIVDARPKDEYESGHIPGSVHLPYEEVGFDPDRLEKFDPGGKPVIVYCGGGTCELSMNLARVLIEAGKKRVLVFMGGWPEWEAARYPVEHGAGQESGS